MRTLHTASAGFEAARTLSGVHHGHSFVLAVQADWPLPALRDRLAAVCGRLDYQDLSAQFAHPDDISLIHHLSGVLDMAAALSLRSAPDRGVELDAAGKAHIWLKTGFEAAHWLPHVPDGHQCGRLHGHGFGVRLLADATRIDHAALLAAWQPLCNMLQHSTLNHIAGLANPTSEVLAIWLFDALAQVLDGVAAVEVFETATAGSRFDAQGLRIWKEQRFEAAVPFDNDGRYTGHSYLVRLHLAGEMDAEQGWVRDFGEVKALFKPLYAQLDHHALDQLPGIAATDCAGIARYLAARFAPDELVRIDLLENETDGALLWLDGSRTCTR
ncbi:6-pyruvoyl trahydropterin synthase family protein [Craterilacuibacter sp.]|uniref:6-pyruvoyl trahydropterin synthase family protein n=1 Tax=Craterilacuibacter sp. TaxID=2870909 RepID=UPI003F30CC25